MSEVIQVWVEIVFKITYLLVIWGLLIRLITQRSLLIPEMRKQANLVIGATSI